MILIFRKKTKQNTSDFPKNIDDKLCIQTKQNSWIYIKETIKQTCILSIMSLRTRKFSWMGHRIMDTVIGNFSKLTITKIDW